MAARQFGAQNLESEELGVEADVVAAQRPLQLTIFLWVSFIILEC